jgi:hypothetical protein
MKKTGWKFKYVTTVMYTYTYIHTYIHGISLNTSNIFQIVRCQKRAPVIIFIHSFIHSSMALQSFGPWPLLQFRNLSYTDGRTPWMSDQPVARPLPTCRTTRTQNKRTQTQSCLEWDLNARSQRSSEQRFHALGRSATVIGNFVIIISY